MPVRAEDSDAFFIRDPNRLVVSVGAYNFTDSESEQRYPSYMVQLRLSEIPVWKMHPWIGFEYAHNTIERPGQSADINSYWIGAGLETDIDLYDDWLVLTLQTGAGYFKNDSDTMPVGWKYLPESGLEFRHQAELGVRFMDGWRAAIGVSHMSNADLSDNNNSINSAALNLHVPLGPSQY